LVSVIFQCSKPFSVDFLQFLKKKSTFEEFEEICEQFQKKRKQYNDKTDIIDSDIDLWTKGLTLSKKL